MSITRFFKDYVYTVFATYAMRQSIRSKRTWYWETLLTLASGFTILLVALWHHVSVNFLIFGLMHALAIIGYQQFKRYKIALPTGLAITMTFLFITTTLPLFRYPDFSIVLELWSVFCGQTALVVPNAVADLLNISHEISVWIFKIVRASEEGTILLISPLHYLGIFALIVFVLIFPNTSQICSYDEDGIRSYEKHGFLIHKRVLRLLSKYYMSFAGILCAISLVYMLWQRPAEFIYWTF